RSGWPQIREVVPVDGGEHDIVESYVARTVATFFTGSRESRAPSVRLVLTAQKRQPRVQVSPCLNSDASPTALAVA
ncbi:hypothetical protein EV182_004094, partial [Spiromyces aspiralis]